MTAPDDRHPAPPEDAGDAALAAWLAARAGDELLGVRATTAPGRGRGAEGDQRSQAFLDAWLRRVRPADAVLSEEALDDPVRLHAERVWIIDPLDGTREFSEEARDDWAVHVALWAAGALATGAVALPAAGIVLRADRPPALPEAMPRRPRLVVSRSRPPAVAGAVADALGMETVPLGSAGAKVAAVVRGEAEAYVHAGGQYEWDSAAPVAVAVAAGLHASRIDGSPLRYNQPDPRLPDLVVCRRELADPILEVLARPSPSAG